MYPGAWPAVISSLSGKTCSLTSSHKDHKDAVHARPARGELPGVGGVHLQPRHTTQAEQLLFLKMCVRRNHTHVRGKRDIKGNLYLAARGP